MNLKEILSIMKMGSFIYPVINFFENMEEDDITKSFFRMNLYKWFEKNKDFFKEVDKIISICSDEETLCKRSHLSIKMLALVRKSALLSNNENKEDVIKIYKELRNNFNNLPDYVRTIVAISMKNLYSKLDTKEIKDVRIWSESYKKDKSKLSFLTFAEAKKEINNKNYKKGIELFYKGAMESWDVPHPTAILNGVDFASWYSIEKNFLEFSSLYGELEFLAGYYYDKISIIYDYLYTVFSSYKKLDKIDTHKITSFMINNKEQIQKNEYYKKRIDSVKKFYYDLNKNSYKLKKSDILFFEKCFEDNSIENILISKVTMNSILKRKISFIKSNTIQKIISSYNISYKTSNPHCINSELIKMNIENNFSHFSSFVSFNNDFFEKILLTYMSLDNKSIDISLIYNLIYKNNKKSLMKIFKNNYDSMILFNSIFESIPFFNARKYLIGLSIDEIKIKNKYHDFISFYFKLDEDEKLLINIFFRNYQRYKRTKFSFNLNKIFKNNSKNKLWKNKIDKISRFFGFEQYFSYISFWCFEEKDRKNFIEIINKFL